MISPERTASIPELSQRILDMAMMGSHDGQGRGGVECDRNLLANDLW